MKNLVTMAALGAMLAAPLAASAQPYGGGMMHHWHRGDRDNVTGRIVARTNSNFRLDNGRTVFLVGGTHINGTLHRGEIVSVQGTDAGNGNINASNVTVQGGGYRR